MLKVITITMEGEEESIHCISGREVIYIYSVNSVIPEEE